MPALERELERPAPRPVHLTTAGRFELTVTLIVSLADGYEHIVKANLTIFFRLPSDVF